ncbi:Ff.00g126980.m01.CDS01 [Fusarium sp. VM40]|nr:Ff.00g126980.m01.CDS01 [Fusarium sp. VM40]
MKHLIVVGACYLDTILKNVTLVYTLMTWTSTDLPLVLNIRRGGNCPNSLQVLEQLVGDRDALQLHLVSPLPDASSSATRRVVSSFGSQSKIDFSRCLYREGRTEAASSYILRSQETGSRTVINYNDLPEMTEDEFGNIARSFEAGEETWWHFETECEWMQQGRIPDTVRSCIRLLRNVLPNANISVEIEKPGREGLPQLASEVDAVFYSRSWAESRGHKTPEDCLKGEEHRMASLALCTWGAEGAAGLSRSSGETVHCRWPAQALAQDVYGGDISVIEYVPPNAQLIRTTHTINRVPVELQKLTAVRDIVPWEQGTHS